MFIYLLEQYLFQNKKCIYSITIQTYLLIFNFSKIPYIIIKYFTLILLYIDLSN